MRKRTNEPRFIQARINTENVQQAPPTGVMLSETGSFSFSFGFCFYESECQLYDTTHEMQFAFYYYSWSLSLARRR